jgi:hypothetical protein
MVARQLPLLPKLVAVAAAAAAAARAAATAPPAQCSACTNCSLTASNKTGWVGPQIVNVSFDLPIKDLTIAPGIATQTCCSMAASSAARRSKNSTDGLGWSIADLGPSIEPEHEDQETFMCTIYDYGAKAVPAANSVAAMTARLPYFPPPPPACESYGQAKLCPRRCYWSRGVCAATPPIACGANTPAGGAKGSNITNALCVHLSLNTSGALSPELQFKLVGHQSSFNETVLSAPPQTITAAKDAWWSVVDGEFPGSPDPLRPFRYCVQYSTDAVPPAQPLGIAVCVSLNGGVFDLQCGVSQTLKYGADWQSNVPYVAAVVVGANQTAAAAAAAGGTVGDR